MSLGGHADVASKHCIHSISVNISSRQQVRLLLVSSVRSLDAGQCPSTPILSSAMHLIKSRHLSAMVMTSCGWGIAKTCPKVSGSWFKVRQSECIWSLKTQIRPILKRYVAFVLNLMHIEIYTTGLGSN